MFEAITIEKPVNIELIRKSADSSYKDFTKGVIDIQRQILVIGTEMHFESEQILLENGSQQDDLWGINLYPDDYNNENFIEFDSMINVRPRQNNRSRFIENQKTRELILEQVKKLIHND